MSNEEKIYLGVAFVGLIAILLYQRATVPVPAGGSEAVTEIGMSLTPTNSIMTRGPSYLMYNAPWAFAPPIGNFLPSITAGQIGQTVNVPTNFASGATTADCGCNG